MKEYTTDTSQVYEHLIGFVAEENLPSTLGEFMGEEEEEYHPKIEPKPRRPDFPEDWQMLYVNVNSLEEYAAFMKLIGQVPLSKLNEFIYVPPGEAQGLDVFFGD